MAIMYTILRRLPWFAGMGVLFLTIGPALGSAEASGGTWRFAAPQQRLFRPLLADPTEARLAITSNLGDRLNGDIGGSWEAADYAWGADGGLRFRTGIHAGVFSKLRRSGTTFPLETADYLIGFHADLGNDRYTGRFEYAHVSAHLADGYEGYGGYEGYEGPSHADHAGKADKADRTMRARRAMTYSREYFTVYGARELRFAPGSAVGSAIGSARVYGSLRWSNHAIPDVRRWRVQGGAELVFRPLSGDGGTTRAYLACDVRLFRDGDISVNRTAHAGLLFHNEASRGLRIAFVYHGGRSEHGQFHHLEDDYAGIGLFFDL
ncbi:MAG: DUF1207 domain-containing protein [Gemmatimonadetes bacterium]|nr:DUF1207 domain-containing protein [Gemmatimonadota bacterium]MYH17511.1 DUF1207 domain-containing protein [Gemmatimonadota bacterium]MYK97246.1 DUF1207 domain-containing protein [Gemmatimonadota bacterium]